MNKQMIVEAWLANLCIQLDRKVLEDNESWDDDFKEQVEAAQEANLIDQVGTGFFWYLPEDEDVENLFEIAKKNMVKD